MKKIKYILFIILILSVTSCNNWLDVNHDPNSLENVDYESVLASGLASVAYVMGGSYEVLGAIWSQQWTQSPGASQYSGIDSYDINSSTYDDHEFGDLYSGALEALQYVRVQSKKEKEWNYYLIATVMQVYTFQVLADLYGEIPFSDALKGDQLVLTPKYDKGQDVYDSLIARLDDALGRNLDKQGLKVPNDQNDIIFSGNMTDWIKFANTLKLKIYLRQSAARPDVAKAGITKLYNDNTDFLDVDAAMTDFQDQSGNRNPLYETQINALGGNPNLILSYTLYSYLVKNGDFKRLNYLFSTPANGGGHKALIQGNYNAPNEPSGTNSSSYSKPIFSPNAPVYLMSVSESDFLQAEAMIRYDLKTYSDAKTMYEDGIIASYQRILGSDYNVSEAESFAQSVYRFPSQGSSLDEFIKSIIRQKWVALSGIQNLETFFEQNRTHIPKISPVPADNNDYVPGEYTVSVNNVTSGQFPRRLIYPESEITGNPNTPATKPVYDPVWWDIEQ